MFWSPVACLLMLVVWGCSGTHSISERFPDKQRAQSEELQNVDADGHVDSVEIHSEGSTSIDLRSEEGRLRDDNYPGFENSQVAENKGGGIIDTSGGDPLYLDALTLEKAVIAAPKILKSIFRRWSLLLSDEKGLEGLYKSYKIPLRLQEIKKSFLIGNKIQPKNIFQVLSENSITINLTEGTCLVDSDHKSASIDFVGNLCLSKQKLLHLPLYDFEIHLYSLLIHEMAHYYGFDEEAASEIQKYFTINRSLILPFESMSALEQFGIDPLAVYSQFIRNQDLEQLGLSSFCKTLQTVLSEMQKNFFQVQSKAVLTHSVSNILVDVANFTSLHCGDISHFNHEPIGKTTIYEKYELILAFYQLLRKAKFRTLEYLGTDIETIYFDELDVAEKLKVLAIAVASKQLNEFQRQSWKENSMEGPFCNLIAGDEDIIDIPVFSAIEGDFTSDSIQSGNFSELGLHITYDDYDDSGAIQAININFENPLSYESFFAMNSELSEFDFFLSQNEMSFMLTDDIRPYVSLELFRFAKFSEGFEGLVINDSLMCSLP